MSKQIATWQERIFPQGYLSTFDEIDKAKLAPIIHAVNEMEADLRAALASRDKDAERLDFLELEANQQGGILLHDGTVTGHRGLGLRPGSLNRTLREAIDTAISAQKGST